MVHEIFLCVTNQDVANTVSSAVLGRLTLEDA